MYFTSLLAEASIPNDWHNLYLFCSCRKKSKKQNNDSNCYSVILYITNIFHNLAVLQFNSYLLILNNSTKIGK